MWVCSKCAKTIQSIFTGRDLVEIGIETDVYPIIRKKCEHCQKERYCSEYQLIRRDKAQQ